MSRESSIFRYLREQADDIDLNEGLESTVEGNKEDNEDLQEQELLDSGYEAIDEDCSLAVCPECGNVSVMNESGLCEDCGAILNEKVKLVVRHGKVMRKILKRKKKKMLTSKQKSALKKARQKAHTSSAKASRKKSMKKARSLKHEGLELTDSQKADLKETLDVLSVPKLIQEAYNDEDYDKVSEYLKDKYGIEVYTD